MTCYGAAHSDAGRSAVAAGGVVTTRPGRTRGARSWRARPPARGTRAAGVGVTWLAGAGVAGSDGATVLVVGAIGAAADRGVAPPGRATGVGPRAARGAMAAGAS